MPSAFMPSGVRKVSEIQGLYSPVVELVATCPRFGASRRAGFGAGVMRNGIRSGTAVIDEDVVRAFEGALESPRPRASSGIRAAAGVSRASARAW